MHLCLLGVIKGITLPHGATVLGVFWSSYFFSSYQLSNSETETTGETCLHAVFLILTSIKAEKKTQTK